MNPRDSQESRGFCFSPPPRGPSSAAPPPRCSTAPRCSSGHQSDAGFSEVAVEGDEPIAIHRLAIARYRAYGAVYRFACDRDWQCVQDADHRSIAEATERLPAQYRREPALWNAR